MLEKDGNPETNTDTTVAMRIRVTFSKTEAMRFTSHLDLYRAWERLLRRAGIPVKFSQGYNPRPRIQLASPLPLGITSQCEIIDIWLLSDPHEPDAIKSRLIQVQPPGIEVQDVEFVDPDSPPLQKKVHAAEYAAALRNPIPNLDRKITGILSAEILLRERRGKSYDLRPLIKELSLSPGSDKGLLQIFMELNAQEGSTGRPEEVLLALEIQPENTRIERIRLIYQA